MKEMVVRLYKALGNFILPVVRTITVILEIITLTILAFTFILIKITTSEIGNLVKQVESDNLVIMKEFYARGNG